MNVSMEKIKDSEKEFIDIFKQLCYSRSSWQVWSDLISAAACSISNATDRTPRHFEQREKEYAQCIERLGSVEKPAKILSIIVMALENNPEQDFLGKMYMNLNLSNHWKGQFFTPYSICKLMSQITVGNVDRKIEKQGYISICDPACGAGATLIAAANTMKSSKYNFQNHVLFVGQDVDRVVAQMCYIQLSLLGCAGYICIGNTITSPLIGPALFPQEKENQELWYMPMFQSDIWQWRKLFNSLESMGGAVTTEKTVEKEHFYVFFGFDRQEEEMENRALQQEFNPVEISEKNQEALQSETWQTIRDASDVSTEYAQEAVSKSNNEENKTEAAKEKYEKSLKACTKYEKTFFDSPVKEYIFMRFDEDKGFCDDFLQEHKTFERCMEYMTNMAIKSAPCGAKGALIAETDFFEWMEDYFRKDDKAEIEAEKKKEAEHKKKEAEKKKSKAKEKNVKAASSLQNKKDIPKEQPKLKKSSKDIDGQLDMFSMIGI